MPYVVFRCPLKWKAVCMHLIIWLFLALIWFCGSKVVSKSDGIEIGCGELRWENTNQSHHGAGNAVLCKGQMNCFLWFDHVWCSFIMSTWLIICMFLLEVCWLKYKPLMTRMVKPSQAWSHPSQGWKWMVRRFQKECLSQFYISCEFRMSKGWYAKSIGCLVRPVKLARRFLLRLCFGYVRSFWRIPVFAVRCLQCT